MMTEEKLEQKRIHQLPVHLANQIAAGEVVERPASVLKELLENSLDAKSTEIDITVERGGIKLIQVQDNGLGICKEDLPLAIASHATSKIASLSDLEGVQSYGFRGEALASISSVSRLELISAVEDQSCGWSIQLEGRDKPPSLQPVAKRSGTLIAVRDLFYNTPARRKFLKSEKTEAAYLEEIFKRIALSQPAVAFKFQQGDGIQKRLPICRSLDAHIRRVAQLCGKRFVEEAYYIEAEANGLKLTGWLGSENAMRSQADLQYFYVNGRIVRDKIVMHAVRQAYQSVNSLGRFPAYVLYFECDALAVDVNVHPTKHEVRFREARTVHAFLSYAIQEGLKQGNPDKTRDDAKSPLTPTSPQPPFEGGSFQKGEWADVDVDANVHQPQQDKPQ
ncbi:MAG TPA: DNA mismatch repair endonuclease MutL, partial [Gammaproteobacteria bacterium]|nr:DNA mismatch repair endonuclease MutL [Gammaproteobacteria bacterium]